MQRSIHMTFEWLPDGLKGSPAIALRGASGAPTVVESKALYRTPQPDFEEK